MKMLVLAGTAAALALTALPQSSEAGSRSYRNSGPSFVGRTAQVRGFTRRRQVRGFSQRDIDRLPINVTRPSNSAHLIYRGYPLWAARAFQPQNRR